MAEVIGTRAMIGGKSQERRTSRFVEMIVSWDILEAMSQLISCRCSRFKSKILIEFEALRWKPI